MRLIAAVRDRMRRRATTPAAAERPPAAAAPRAAAPRSPARRPSEPGNDHELEQLAAEARYHRDRFELYQARVMSGSTAATSLTRLRELQRTAEAASDRLAHARRSRRRAAEQRDDADSGQ